MTDSHLLRTPQDGPALGRGARIFLSYRRSAAPDNQLAHTLRDGLVSAGHEVFIDTGMRVGTEWVREIEQRIIWCDYLVVLLSADAVASEMVSERSGAPTSSGSGCCL